MAEEIKIIAPKGDLDWFSKNFSKEEMNLHAGEWIAIQNRKVLSSGKDFREVLKEAKIAADRPLLIKIPKKKEILVL